MEKKTETCNNRPGWLAKSEPGMGGDVASKPRKKRQEQKSILRFARKRSGTSGFPICMLPKNEDRSAGYYQNAPSWAQATSSLSSWAASALSAPPRLW